MLTNTVKELQENTAPTILLANLKEVGGEDALEKIQLVEKVSGAIPYLESNALISGVRAICWGPSKWSKFENSFSKETYLQHAASTDRTDLIEQFIEKGYRLNLRDELGNTALHTAASRGFSRSVFYLIDQGIDVEAKNKHGETYVDSALKNRQKAFIIELINSKVKLDYPRILKLVIQTKNEKLLPFLREKISVENYNKVLNSFDRTPTENGTITSMFLKS